MSERGWSPRPEDLSKKDRPALAPPPENVESEGRIPERREQPGLGYIKPGDDSNQPNDSNTSNVQNDNASGNQQQQGTPAKPGDDSTKQSDTGTPDEQHWRRSELLSSHRDRHDSFRPE